MEITLETIKAALSNQWEVNEFEAIKNKRIIQIGGARQGFYVSISQISDQDAVLEDYQTFDYPDKRFAENLSDSVFFLATYSDIAMLNQAILPILKIENPSRCWIDNDYGQILMGDLAIKSIEKDPLWNWKI